MDTDTQTQDTSLFPDDFHLHLRFEPTPKGAPSTQLDISWAAELWADHVGFHFFEIDEVCYMRLFSAADTVRKFRIDMGLDYLMGQSAVHAVPDGNVTLPAFLKLLEKPIREAFASFVSERLAEGDNEDFIAEFREHCCGLILAHTEEVDGETIHVLTTNGTEPNY